MTMSQENKVGIIACSGEEIAAGTLTRLATRRVLEMLRPQSTVTLCLPLFLAGEEQERRFARLHPTITVDGCDKLCAKRGTEQYSGQVQVSLIVNEVLGERVAKCHRSSRDFDRFDEEAVFLLAERIAAEVDSLSQAIPEEPTSQNPGTASCGCACGSPPPEANIQLDGKTVAVNGLPLIFAHLYKQGLRPGPDCAEQVLQTASIYHEIRDEQRESYRSALAAAFEAYCSRQKPESVPLTLKNREP
jgi:uncharacterized metal-binding protein